VNNLAFALEGASKADSQTEKNAPVRLLTSPHLGTESRDYSGGLRPAKRGL